VKAWMVVALTAGLVTEPLWLVAPRGWPPQLRRALAWGGAHVAAAFTIFWFMPYILVPLIRPADLARWFFGANVEPEIANRLALTLASTLALPLQLLAWRGLLAMADPPATAAIVPRQAARDVRFGYFVWLLLTPGIYLIHWASLWVHAKMGGQPDEHPLLRMIESGAMPAGVMLLLTVEVVLAAPVREELLFRGILQPWLADRRWGGDMGLLLAMLVGTLLHTPNGLNWSDPVAVASLFAPALLIIAMVPLIQLFQSWPRLRRWLPIRDSDTHARTLRAIFASAAIFANVHATVWPTPVPLIFLGLGLGWLAVRTQGVTGPIMVHALFNAVAFSELAFK